MVRSFFQQIFSGLYRRFLQKKAAVITAVFYAQHNKRAGQSLLTGPMLFKRNKGLL